MAPLPPRAPLGNATTRRSSNAATSNERSADQLKMITKDTLPPAKGNKRNNKAKNLIINANNDIVNISNKKQKISVTVAAPVSKTVPTLLKSPPSVHSVLARESSTAEEAVADDVMSNITDHVIENPRTESTISSNQQDEYSQWRIDLGSTTTYDNEKRAVQRYVRETLFSKLKFIRSDHELEHSGKFKGTCVIGFAITNVMFYKVINA